MGFLDAFKIRAGGVGQGIATGGLIGGIFGGIKAGAENRAQTQINQKERELQNMHTNQMDADQRRMTEDIITGRQGLRESYAAASPNVNVQSTGQAEAEAAQERENQARMEAAHRARRGYEIGLKEDEIRRDLAKMEQRTGYQELAAKKAAELAAGAMMGGAPGGAMPGPGAFAGSQATGAAVQSPFSSIAAQQLAGGSLGSPLTRRRLNSGGINYGAILGQ